MEILIGGDLVPTKANLKLFIEGNVEKLLGESLLEQWMMANIRIFNLECPLIDKDYPILKKGPNLRAPTSTINGISSLKPSLVALANNHIFDHGIEGLNSTVNVLKKYNIPFIGIGKNLTDASKPYILKKNGFSIGVYACSEHEFSIATNNSPGANPFDPLESLDHISKLKDKTDYVIVLYHGGKEHYRYPSPYLQKVCRKIVEKGADLVVCQHSHSIGAYEEYKNSTIIYGQGNFIFNLKDNEYWNTSILVKVVIKNKVSIEYLPIVKTKEGTRLASDKEAREIIYYFKLRSEEIKSEEFLKKKYREIAKEHLYIYLRQIYGFSKVARGLDRLLNGFFINRKINDDKLLSLQNFIECEAHRELLIEGLIQKLDEIKRKK